MKSNTLIIDKLNLLLADFQIYYQNLRGFHWNIQGREFFELHVKFEELLTSIHNPLEPFVMTEIRANCRNCPYSILCGK